MTVIRGDLVTCNCGRAWHSVLPPPPCPIHGPSPAAAAPNWFNYCTVTVTTETAPQRPEALRADEV